MNRKAMTWALISIFVGGPGHAATIRMFSYDPADAETRAAAGPMTFEFNQGLLKTTLISMRSTEAEATVDLSPAPDSVLGVRGLIAMAGPEAAGRNLYAIGAADDGAALVSALCPGSTRGWLAIGRPRYGVDLGVDVLGDTPNGGLRLCRKLAFNFHGEWRGPDQGKYDTRIAARSRGPRG